jgi:hypothetical protein
VASRAGGWITGSDVIRYQRTQIRGALPLRSVASVAIRWRRGGTGVAKAAGHGGVRAGQREGRIGVIEIETCPIHRGVADGAIGREPRRNVVGYRASKRCGALPGGDMAPVARGGIERIVVIHVTGKAGCRSRGNVQARQVKPRPAVVECCGRPTRRRVAVGTVSYRKRGSGGGVRRGNSLLPVRQMAAGSSASGRGDR